MKSFFTLLFFSAFLNLCSAQTKIELKDVAKHVGDTVRVEGKIYGVKTFPENAKSPTLLNLGADFPQQVLTIAVFPSYKTDSIEMPDERFKGDIAIVTGKVELYKGKLQIVVRSSEALRIVTSNAVTPAKQ
jgi:hypothetical protein